MQNLLITKKMIKIIKAYIQNTFFLIKIKLKKIINRKIKILKKLFLRNFNLNLFLIINNY